jgi:Family of unknown function (DUF6600)
MQILSVRRLRSSLLIGVALVSVPIAVGFIGAPYSSAQAQDVRVSIEFRSALEPYGRWVSHGRYREVWVPEHRPRGWRPYTQGHWIYTDEWGWYWISERDENDFGWVTYHYGRWVWDRDLGWVWIPGQEWAPAWVDWRRGNNYIGWAPLPPDDVVVEYREDPQYWIFVRPRDVVAPSLSIVILPPRQQTIYFQETVVVNRTVVIDNQGAAVAVNPGVPPAYVAAAARRPVETFAVQPRVLVGTRGVQGAVEVRPNELRSNAPNQRPGAPTGTQPVVQKSATVIQPAATVPPPQPLRPEEKGRLGATPPKAAQGATEPKGTTPTPTTAPQGGNQPPAAAPGSSNEQRSPRLETERPSKQQPSAPAATSPSTQPSSPTPSPSQAKPSAPPVKPEAPKSTEEKRGPGSSPPPPSSTSKEKVEPPSPRSQMPKPSGEPAARGTPPAEKAAPATAPHEAPASGRPPQPREEQRAAPQRQEQPAARQAPSPSPSAPAAHPSPASEAPPHATPAPTGQPAAKPASPPPNSANEKKPEKDQRKE